MASITSALLLLSTGCAEKSPVSETQVNVCSAFVHPLFFQEEIAAQVNFPFWFNDSTIATQGISQIDWAVYYPTASSTSSTSTGSVTEATKEPNFIKTLTQYYFRKNGALSIILRTEYNEGIAISTKQYTIAQREFDEFKQVTQTRDKRKSTNVSSDPYVLLFKSKPKKNIIQYDDQIKNVRYHFIPNTSNWGGLSVESIAHPRKQDWVICGIPSKPEKRYQVINTVKEKTTTTYSYFNQNYPSLVTTNDYPFSQKRHFKYTKNGLFIGYVDSTFADDTFITSTITLLQLDSLQRPIKIIHSKRHAESSKNHQLLERISYTIEKP